MISMRPTSLLAYFSQSRSAMAFVNLKPIVPGHVLVCPRRVATRLAELAPREAGELFEAAHALSQCLLHAYSEKRAAAGEGQETLPGVAPDAPAPTSLTVGIQDGADAGQSIDVCITVFGCFIFLHYCDFNVEHSVFISVSQVQYKFISTFYIACSRPPSSEKTERF